jgi:hypothetical protein
MAHGASVTKAPFAQTPKARVMLLSFLLMLELFVFWPGCICSMYAFWLGCLCALYLFGLAGCYCTLFTFWLSCMCALYTLLAGLLLRALGAVIMLSVQRPPPRLIPLFPPMQPPKGRLTDVCTCGNACIYMCVCRIF